MPYYSLPDPSDFCPGCNRTRCQCPPPWWEDAQHDDAYTRGYDAGTEDGAENRPDPAWLASWHNPHREYAPEAYLGGYDDGAAGKPNAVLAAFERTQKAWTHAPDDGDALPF